MAKGVHHGLEDTDDSMFSGPLSIGTVKTLGAYCEDIRSKSENIETWKCSYPDEGCGMYDSCTRAEVKIKDNNNNTKYVQVSLNDEVSSFSVSIHSLHEYDPDNLFRCWTIDSCDECFVCQRGDFDEEESSALQWLLDESELSKYHTYYNSLADALKTSFPNECLKVNGEPV